MTIEPPYGEHNWPANIASVYAWREKQLAKFEMDPKLAESAKAYYAENIHEFINHWVDTYDPRNLAQGRPARIPLVMFLRQEELIEFIIALIQAEADGLIEKARDMGATWVCVGISAAMWLLWDGAAIGWGSRKQELVDRLGDPSSIFEKIRMVINGLPHWFLPEGFNRKEDMHYMKIVNPENGSSIIGEIGDEIGRGGRTLIYFKDESAHYARPERIEAALGDNTRVQVDISSVSGLGTVFHRKRKAGTEWAPGTPAIPGTTNVFVMDWSHHPAKDEKWHKQREAGAKANGLLHVFKREVERDYAASVEGVIIPSAHAKAAIDAHIKLGIEPSGDKAGALDVADEGIDKNAQIIRHGILCLLAEQWAKGDTGETTNKSIELIQPFLHPSYVFENQYDAVGVGAGVKSEVNRKERLRKDPTAREEDKLPKGLRYYPWRASAPLIDPMDFLSPGDPDTPRNKDFFHNFKAQAWWLVARRFEITYRAITEPGFTYDPDMIISISSAIPMLWTLIEELSQPIMKKAVASSKLLVDKKPDGAASPNLADGFIMCYVPARKTERATLGDGGLIAVGGD